MLYQKITLRPLLIFFFPAHGKNNFRVLRIVIVFLDDTKWCNYGLKTPNLWPSASCPSEDKGHSCVSSMCDERSVVVLWQKRERRERGWDDEVGGRVVVGVGLLALQAHMTFTWVVWIKPSQGSRSLWRKHLHHATWAELLSPNLVYYAWSCYCIWGYIADSVTVNNSFKDNVHIYTQSYLKSIPLVLFFWIEGWLCWLFITHFFLLHYNKQYNKWWLLSTFFIHLVIHICTKLDSVFENPVVKINGSFFFSSLF